MKLWTSAAQAVNELPRTSSSPQRWRSHSVRILRLKWCSLTHWSCLSGAVFLHED
jgi:hypothetical protein